MRTDDPRLHPLTMSPEQVMSWHVQDQIRKEFNLEGSMIAANLLLESQRLGVDPHDALKQLKKHLPLVVAEELAVTERLLLREKPSHQSTTAPVSWWKKWFNPSPKLA